MNVEFTVEGSPDADAYIIGYWRDGGALGLPDSVPHLISAQAETIVKDKRARGVFSGEIGESATLEISDRGRVRTIIVVGMGDAKEISPLDAEKVGGVAVAALIASGRKSATVAMDFGAVPWELAQHVALGASMRNYRFTKHKRAAVKQRAQVDSLVCLTRAPDQARKGFSQTAGVREGVFLARDLVNEPPNVLNPDTFAEILSASDIPGLTITEVNEQELEQLGMTSILAVGKSSNHAPRLIVMEWRGATDDEAPVALVGKGITFDTGGLIVKPIEQMKPMKGDMAGAAACAGAIAALAKQKAPVNALAVLAVAENSVSAAAYRPSDVIETVRGDTIEITHTDAEGRLALLDALWYATHHFKPQAVVSIGTLGGSGLFGLGTRHGALYCEDEATTKALLGLGEAAGEPLWQLPLFDELDDQLRESDVADLIQAPDFFVHGADSAYVYKLLKPSVSAERWAHLEMCRLEFAREDRPTCPKGATGYGVRLLSSFAASHISSKA